MLAWPVMRDYFTADDLAIFCQMLLNGGVYNGFEFSVQ